MRLENRIKIPKLNKPNTGSDLSRPLLSNLVRGKRQFAKAAGAALLLTSLVAATGNINLRIKADTASNGLNASYFNDKNLSTLALTRIDKNIDFNWGNGSPDPSIGKDNFSVRWEGLIVPRYSENYTFSTYSDDGVRLWVDNQLIVDNWTDHSATVNTGSIILNAGNQYSIKMEYYENVGRSVAKLSWVSASQPFETVPSSQLYAAASAQLTSTAPTTSTPTLTAPATTSSSSAGINLGQPNSILVSVTNPAAAISNAVVDIEIYDSSNVKSYQQYFSGQNLAANQTAPYTITWTPTAAGTYSVRYGLFDSGWSTVYYWQNNAQTITVGSTAAPITTQTTSMTTTANNSSNPFAGAKLYWNQNNDAHVWANNNRSSNPTNAALMDKIGNQPEVEWLGGWNSNISNDVGNFMNNITQQGALPVFVLYNIPNRDCGGYSQGGASTASDYQNWVQAISNTIGNRKAVIILEPDAISLTTCLSAQDLAARYSLLQNAVNLFSSKGQSVYIDAGHPNWISATDMANRLTQAGVANAAGFALNISNFFYNSDNASYGQQISALIGGKHFIVDTGRNGLGPTADQQWCNPSGRALGNAPTVNTGNPLIDAYLWVKGPGGSDGNCNGGPAAGVFWPDYALGLASRANW